jgi:nucleoside-diphosphate-sugar epimerase
MYPDEVVFGNNTLSTFAVLQAASLLGVSRAVVASSGSSLGRFLRSSADFSASR